MKKKGFTLIELLAVIVVLGILALLIVPNVAGTIKNQKKNLYKTQIKNIEDAAKGWAAEHFFNLPTADNEEKIIYLKDLSGYIDVEINNPMKDEPFGKCLAIKITKIANTEGYTYEVDEDTIDDNNIDANGDCIK